MIQKWVTDFLFGVKWGIYNNNSNENESCLFLVGLLLLNYGKILKKADVTMDIVINFEKNR